MCQGRVHGGNPPPLCHDFSAPMNPLGPPPWLGELLEECRPRLYTVYPDPGYRELREAIADFHGLDPREIVVANGAAELLAVLPLVLRARRVVVVEPNYGDHGLLPVLGIRVERVALRQLGRGECSFDVEEAVELAGEHGLVVVSRPNNPTGCIVPEDIVYDAGRRLAARGSYLAVDEAYIDLSPGASPLTVSDGVILVRSFTKTFATPGLRLGYATGPLEVVGMLDAARQPWPVGGPETCVYSVLLRDTRTSWYLSAARTLVGEEVVRLCGRLQGLGYRCTPPRAPLILLGHPWARHPGAWWRLARLGVCVRDASSFHGLTPHHTRVAVRTPGENDVLLWALERLAREA